MTESAAETPIGTGRTLFIVLLGAALTVVGVWGTVVVFRLLQFTNSLTEMQSPFTSGSTLYYVLWLVAGLSLLIAGISLIVSGLRRKRHDLVPGPTLYFLGLSLCGIGFFLLTFGQIGYSVAAIIIGLLLIYWEWTLAIT